MAVFQKEVIAMYSVGMIGAGLIAPRHIAAVAAHPDTVLTAVADLCEDRARAAAEPCGAAVYTDYRVMLDQAKPDIVIINLPHALHEACVLACAERGIHILLEKPMSVSYASCLRMIDACRRNHVFLQIGHIQRYMPHNRAARMLIESGNLGSLVMLCDQRTINYFVPTRPAWFFRRETAGGGIWMNYGAHSLDKLCYLTNSRVASVTGSCTWCAENADVDGSAQVLARTESGVSETISLCGYSVVPQDETMIYLTNGSLRLHTGRGLWLSQGGEYVPVEIDSSYLPFNAQWNDFIEGIRCGCLMHCSGEYAADIIRHIESVWT